MSLEDFEQCSPTACGCRTKDDCPNQHQFAVATFQCAFPECGHIVKFSPDGKATCVNQFISECEGPNRSVLQSEKEHLQKENAELKDALFVEQQLVKVKNTQLEVLQAENTRLREALDAIDTYIESAIHKDSPVFKVIKSYLTVGDVKDEQTIQKEKNPL